MDYRLVWIWNERLGFHVQAFFLQVAAHSLLERRPNLAISFVVETPTSCLYLHPNEIHIEGTNY